MANDEGNRSGDGADRDSEAPKAPDREEGGGRENTVAVERLPGEDGAKGEDSHQLVPREEKFPGNLFIIPLKDFVVLPGIMMPIQLSTQRAQKTVEQARAHSEYLGFLTLKNSDLDPDEPEDLFETGTLVRVAKVLNLPDGSISILIQGLRRFRVERFLRKTP